MDDCKTPELMFVTTEDLNKHILEEHGSHRWVCNYCADEADELHRDDTFIYDTAEDWVSHVKDDHLPNIPVSQLQELSPLSQREFVQPMGCPLCDVTVSTVQAGLDAHIAGHLYSFALRALPWGLSQGSHESDTPRFSANIESETSHVSSKWEHLSNLSDLEWPGHEKPAIKNWSDWHDMKGEAVIRENFIEGWVQDIPDFPASDKQPSDGSELASDKEQFHRAEPTSQQELAHRGKSAAKEKQSIDSELEPNTSFRIAVSRHTISSTYANNHKLAIPNTELRLLAIDGGGVRGLSALIILEQLMGAVNPDAPPKPCDYFDMIGGTSTGG